MLGSAAALAGAAAPFPVAARAAPVRGSQRITLSFQPWQYAYGFQSLPTSFNRILYEATAPFRQAHPGINLVFFGPQTNPYASVLAGEGPDVPQLQGGGGSIVEWMQQGLLVDLSPRIQQANINMADFDFDQVADATGSAGAIYGVPNYTGTSGYVVNLSALDQLGLKYPSPNWTYLEWEHLARSVSGKAANGQQRLGTTIDSGCTYGNAPDSFYFHGWGASVRDAANPARCALDSPAAIACGEFLYSLVWGNVAQWGWVPSNFQQGLTVLPFCWLQSYIIPAATQWHGFKWDFWPSPAWPKGSTAMTNPNFFAISSSSKQPDAAWELLYWLTIEPYWQRALMRTALLPPGYLPLWDEWVTTVQQVAPTLRGKNLSVFAQQVHSGIMCGGLHFAYEDTQAHTILQNWFTQIDQRKVSVSDGFRQAAQEVNALEATGAKMQAAQTARILAVEASVRSGATLTAPPKTGLGAPPQPAARGAVTRSSGGGVVLVAAGADVWDPTANCVFACAASTARQAEFTCRVTLLANVNCPHLSQWAKVGLMAAGDLSDEAAAVTLELTGENGIYQQLQFTSAGGWNATGPSSATAGSGLIGNAVLTVPNSKKVGNYLLKPVWLRMSRNGLVWRTYTSLDGTDWTQAGPDAALEAAGVWVGLFATAHNSSFGGKGQIRAAFDHLSFPATDVVQVGTP